MENVMEENLCEHRVQRIRMGRKNLKNEGEESEDVGIK